MPKLSAVSANKDLVLRSVVTLFVLLVSFQASADIQFDAKKAQAHCMEKWTKRGNVDGGMVSYCMTQQTNGYGDTLAFTGKYKDVRHIEGIIKFAQEKWLAREYQYDMVAFTIKKEAEAFLDIEYDLQKGRYSKAIVEACTCKWVKPTSPQWSMVVFCAKQHAK